MHNKAVLVYLIHLNVLPIEFDICHPVPDVCFEAHSVRAQVEKFHIAYFPRPKTMKRRD